MVNCFQSQLGKCNAYSWSGYQGRGGWAGPHRGGVAGHHGPQEQGEVERLRQQVKVAVAEKKQVIVHHCFNSVLILYSKADAERGREMAERKLLELQMKKVS